MKFIKKILAIIFSIILVASACLVNMYFACKYNTEFPNIFTAISGWISGIATIVLGVIAFWQNKRYKVDSEELIKKQYDYEVFRNIVDKREKFIDTVKSRLYQFCDRFNYTKITCWLAELQILYNENPNRSIKEVGQVLNITQFQEELSLDYVDLKQLIKDDWYEGPYNEELLNVFDKYFTELKTDLYDIDYSNIPETIKRFNQKYSEIFLELLKEKNKYISSLDVDINMVLTKKSGDLDFIKKHYCYIKENNNNG